MAEVIVITERDERSRRTTQAEAKRDNCGGAAELIHPLRARGHRVTAARTMDEVLSHLRRRCPDLLVLPVSMLDAKAIPLIESLCPPRGATSVGTTVALYWDRVDLTLDAPRRFGAGYFVARGADMDATCDRLLACLPVQVAAEDQQQDDALRLPLEVQSERAGEAVRVVA